MGRFVIGQPDAALCIHVPIFEMTVAVHIMVAAARSNGCRVDGTASADPA